MNNSIVSKKLVGAFLIGGLLVIILAIVGALIQRRQGHNEQVGNNSLVQSSTIRNIVPANQLPDKFPGDFPLEAGAKILQNDTQISPAGRFQATRSYETAKTLAENYTIFQTYFQRNGWAINSTIDQATFKSLTAVKGDLSIKVTINDNQLTKTKVVDLYLIQIIATK